MSVKRFVNPLFDIAQALLAGSQIGLGISTVVHVNLNWNIPRCQAHKGLPTYRH
jgi:hypothetical protein